MGGCETVCWLNEYFDFDRILPVFIEMCHSLFQSFVWKLIFYGIPILCAIVLTHGDCP